jgi:hypothetical protein
MSKRTLNDYVQELNEIQGWLYPEDVLLFQEINALQGLGNISGDLLEIGVYHGKTAILMGYFARYAERLVVCDLFQLPGQIPENQAEKNSWYPELTREIFETNYLRFHSELPFIVTCASTRLIQAGRLKKCFRFIHIDGSHLFSIFRQDLRTAKRLLVRKGVLAIDDYRSVHTPGVAAAAWQEVTSGRLVPFCLTPQKMYATWHQSNDVLREHLTAWAKKRGDLAVHIETVNGRNLLRLECLGLR